MAEKAPGEKKSYDLIIVESPNKIKTINKFLGGKYVIKASNGHIRDLPKSKIGVDVENNYEPEYIQIRGKGDIIKQLKTQASGASKVYLATDPDREGEAISWHIAKLLNLPEEKYTRIEFNEITESAVKNALNFPREINVDLVNAQQARRVLDRLVGYKLSPFLWRKVKKGLSAGRVQSVAVKIICDREKEINEFVSKEYWTITVFLTQDGKNIIEAKFSGRNGDKLEIENEAQAKEILSALENGTYTVEHMKRAEKKRHPFPPFTTSTLQQEANTRLGFTSKRTMLIAQQLYEGIDLGTDGSVGLISYIRTDSVHISQEAIDAVREQIISIYGQQYVSPSPNYFKGKKNAQNAHEAIRPSYMKLSPDSVKEYLNKEQYKLYKLIYDRFFACQMADAVFDTISADITCANYDFKATASTPKFRGYLAAYDNSVDTDDTGKSALSAVKEGDVLTAKDVAPKQNFTQPPPRYTEATLTKLLEEKGVGRPSTYVPIISTIQDRGYVERQAKALVPTELGIIVNDMVSNNFKDIVNVEFTAQLEDGLDDVSNGSKEWKKLVDEYYRDFERTLDMAEKTVQRVELPVEESDEVCDKCGAKMVYKEGRFGRFLACPNYPECKNTKAIVKALDVPCPKCGKRIIVRKTKSKKTFYGCEGYPECDYVSWDMLINEKCPTCGSLMSLSRLSNGRSYKKCSNSECPTNAKRKKETDEK